jgi:hypothetical protein
MGRRPAATRFEALLAARDLPLAAEFARAGAAARADRTAATARDTAHEPARDPAHDPAHAGAIRDVAAGVAAPVLVSYVAWILHDAAARGLGRVYFLARDGQVLYEIARALAPRLAPGIACRYLYASRQAWLRNVADLQATDAKHWLWWGVWQGFVPGETTLANLLLRLGVPGRDLDGDLDGVLAAAGFGPAAHTRPLGADDIARLEAFFKTEAFAAALARSRAANRRLMRDYLAQEGLFDGVPSAMVDIGWAGNLHAALAAAQEAEGAAPAHGYYFGYNRKLLAARSALRSRYLYGYEDGAEVPAFKPRFKQELVEIYVEIFCTADHGTLAGFREEAGRVVPDLAPGWDARMRAWGLAELRRTLEAVCAHLDVAALSPEALMAMRGPLRDLLEAFWMHPGAAEARAWGAFPVEIGEGHGSRALPLAEPYRPADLLALVAGRARMRRHGYFWIEGALAMTPAPLRAGLVALRAARDRALGARED